MRSRSRYRSIMKTAITTLALAGTGRAQDPREEELTGAIVRVPSTPPPRGPVRTVELVIDAARAPGSSDVAISARARNRSRSPVTLELADDCGDGASVIFSGLPVGYDYDDACRRGACAARGAPRRVTIAPGATFRVATITVRPKGGACNAALPPGRFAVTFALPSQAEGLRVVPPRRKAIIVQDRLREDAPEAPGDAVRPGSAPLESAPSQPCPSVDPCAHHCPFGFLRDSRGCASCSCAPSPARRPAESSPAR